MAARPVRGLADEADALARERFGPLLQQLGATRDAEGAVSLILSRDARRRSGLYGESPVG